MTKLDDLFKWFSNKNRVIVALSGGVDSALVAYAAYKKLGNDAIAVTADYKTLSHDELNSSKKISAEIGIRQIILEYDELENEDFVKNDSNRCFYCRMELSEYLTKIAKDLDADCVVDGSHIEDLGDYRPGIKAIRKNGIKSPLIETNFMKNEIRFFAKFVGLSIFDKPSNSCLASRIPWGQRVTAEKLTRIEMSEKIVRDTTNLKQVRVRDIDGSAKVEVEKNNVSVLYQKDIFQTISDKLTLLGFRKVLIDAEGYKPGKINVINP